MNDWINIRTYFIEQFNIPYPNHIKIDVDGIEREVIEGAQKILFDDHFKSIAIEITEHNSELVDFFKDRGFILPDNMLIYQFMNHIENYMQGVVNSDRSIGNIYDT